MVIQITDQVNVLRELEIIIEEPHFHLTANQKTNKAKLSAQKSKTVPEQSSQLLNLYNINPNMRSSLLPYIKIKFINGISCRSLIDTGACAKVISNKLLQEVTETNKKAVKLKQPDFTSVKMAEGQLVRIEKQAEINYKLAHREIVEDFFVLSSTNTVILAKPFLVKYNISISQKQALIQLPDPTVQINEIKPVNETRRSVRHKKIPLYTNKKHTIQPTEQIVPDCYQSEKTNQFENKSGVITPNRILDKEILRYVL